MFKKILSLATIVCFFLTTLGPLPKAHADAVLDLPAPGTMVNLSPAYEPVIIRGLTVHKDNPFLFDFIVDVGQDKMSSEPLKKEGEKLIKYFLASLAIPDKDVWVNLSPYEKNKMIPNALGQTDMGRDLLEQDYILKQITASLISPEKELGKKFWDKVYAQAQQAYGTNDIPVNTFNKVWIVADKAEVFEHHQTAFVVGSHLKVMLEEDYLALQKHSMSPSSSVVMASEAKPSHTIASQIVRTIILPALEKEVNTGKNFANLRQIFNSIILSSWYKRSLKEALLNQVYADKSKVRGINLNDPMVKQQIYEQYLKAYKKGVFNYIKEDINAANGQTMPRKYFSGGINEAMAATPVVITNLAMGSQELAVSLPANRAMVVFKTGIAVHRGILPNNAGTGALSNAAMASTPASTAVDIGGTKIEVAIVTRDKKGNFSTVKFSRTMPTSEAKGNPIEFFKKVAGFIKSVQNEAIGQGFDVLPVVGIGSPGRFIDDGHGGKIIAPGSAANLGNTPSAFDGVNPEKELGELLSETVVVHNDGIAQMMFLYKNLQSEPLTANRIKDQKVAYIGPGTGLGGGFLNERKDVITDGHIYDLKISDNSIDLTVVWQGNSLNVTLSGGAESFFSGGNAIGSIMMAIHGQALQAGLEEPFLYPEEMTALNTKEKTFNWFKENGGKRLNEILESADKNSEKYALAKKIAEFEGRMLALIVTHIHDGKIEKVNSSADWSESDRELVRGTKFFLLGGSMMKGTFGETVKQTAERELDSSLGIELIMPSMDTTRAGVLGAAGFVAAAAHEAIKNAGNKGAMAPMLSPRDRAMNVATKEPWEKGGIDLNTMNGMQWKVSKDGKGVEMNVDPAMIQRVQREGIDWLFPVIFKMTPVASIWPLLGLQAPVPQERLAGV